ncbi:MAG: RidA family protein [Gammaproteobacteria bacterium]|nr:RidA family protein [Gammaproteobacteria bacterium]
MGTIESRLQDLGLKLPAPLVLPSPNRTSAVQVKDMLYLSGHGAALLEDESVMRRGKLGREVSQEEGYRTARALALKMLATIKHHVGDLDRVARVVKILGMINAVPDFERHNKVLDGASDLLFEVFGPEIGCHGRSSVGVGGLVADQPVEIEGIFLIRT